MTTESKANSNSNSNSNNNDDGDDNKHDGDDDGNDPTKLAFYSLQKYRITSARPEWKKDWENAFLSLNSEGQVDLFLNSYWEEFRGNKKKKKEIVAIYEEYTKVEAEVQPQPVDYVKMNEFLDNCKNRGLPTVSEMVLKFPDAPSPDPEEDGMNARITRFFRFSDVPTNSQRNDENRKLDDGKRVSLLECLMFIFSKSVHDMLYNARPALVDRVEKVRKGMWVMERIRKMREVLIQNIMDDEDDKKKKNKNKKKKAKLNFDKLIKENKKAVLNSSADNPKYGIIIGQFVESVDPDNSHREEKRALLPEYDKTLRDCGFAGKGYKAAARQRDAVEKALAIEIEQGSDATKWFKSQIS